MPEQSKELLCVPRLTCIPCGRAHLTVQSSCARQHQGHAHQHARQVNTLATHKPSRPSTPYCEMVCSLPRLPLAAWAGPGSR